MESYFFFINEQRLFYYINMEILSRRPVFMQKVSVRAKRSLDADITGGKGFVVNADYQLIKKIFFCLHIYKFNF